MENYHEQFNEAVRHGRMIEAIKAYRLWKVIGLREAADYVQHNWHMLQFCDRNGVKP